MSLKVLIGLGLFLFPICSYGAVATDAYVENLVGEHVEDKENPHSVTAAQVGLGNVQNFDTTNADNITSGTLATERLNIGNSAGTVAAGDDSRFYTVSTTQPTGTPPEGSVFVWFD